MGGLSPGMAIPLKTISISFWEGGLIFEGFSTKALAECVVPTSSKLPQTL
jgi:hypothetical protein